MIPVESLPDDLSQRVFELALASYQYACARVAHRKAMGLIRAAAYEMDKNRHVVYFTDNIWPSMATEYWHNSVLGEHGINPYNIDFEAQPTSEALNAEKGA